MRPYLYSTSVEDLRLVLLLCQKTKVWIKPEERKLVGSDPNAPPGQQESCTAVP